VRVNAEYWRKEKELVKLDWLPAALDVGYRRSWKVRQFRQLSLG
jgi:hypothetical protein